MRTCFGHKPQKNPARSPRHMLERLEDRCLKSVTITTTTTDSLTYLSGTYMAQIQVGDNGQLGGSPGAIIGTNGTETGSTDVLWSTNEDGFYSGWRGVIFYADTESGGNQDLNVNGADAELSSPTTSGNLSKVSINAIVATSGMCTQWSTVVVEFYHGDTQVDSAQITIIQANTINSQNSDPAETITTVTTDAQNVNYVVVDGCFRMQSIAGVYPGPTDMMGQIAIS